MLTVMLAAAAASACTFEREGPPEYHYQEFKTEAPRGNTVFVCHAYGCQMQSPVVFGPAQVKEIAAEMKRVRKADTPAEERRAIAYAVGWMERYVGEKVGTKGDRPGMEFNGPGDPTQQDCVDEATNTTSYLLILQKNGLLKHHTVYRPFSRGNILLGVSNWVHWTATMHDKSTGVKWAVDSWIYANGENPAVVEADKWYTKDLNNLPKSST
ncbi:MAG: hypothetical protein NW215_05690 [Hyphomicrobiales bacterium]|nr:hypothetical protein [Hyphomicrobiales bacterium]